MKKLLTLFLTIALVFSGISLAYAAEEPKVYLTTTAASAGDTVDVVLKISGCDSIGNLAFDIAYDEDILTLIGVSDALDENARVTHRGSEYFRSPYTVKWIMDENICYSGELATFRFKVADGATENARITLSYQKGRNGDYIDGVDVNYGYVINKGKLIKTPLNLTYYSGGVFIDDPEEYDFYVAEYDENHKMIDIRKLDPSVLVNLDRAGHKRSNLFVLSKDGLKPISWQ